MSKYAIIKIPLATEVTWYVVSKTVDTTLDEVGDLAHICQFCKYDHSERLMEICQNGLFGVDKYQLYMYCANCLQCTIWCYEVDTREEPING